VDSIEREEEQFQRTLERASAQLDDLLKKLDISGEKILSGEKAADLYTTYGMPFEISRDIARERGLDADEAGFHDAMDKHRFPPGCAM
jgi:alanyl-tRNA synthetase